jgi:hypothetical protein
MLSMPAKAIGSRRYRQNRFAVCMVSSVDGNRALKGLLPPRALMLAGISAVAQDARTGTAGGTAHNASATSKTRLRRAL